MHNPISLNERMLRVYLNTRISSCHRHCDFLTMRHRTQTPTTTMLNDIRYQNTNSQSHPKNPARRSTKPSESSSGADSRRRRTRRRRTMRRGRGSLLNGRDGEGEERGVGREVGGGDEVLDREERGGRVLVEVCVYVLFMFYFLSTGSR